MYNSWCVGVGLREEGDQMSHSEKEQSSSNERETRRIENIQFRHIENLIYADCVGVAKLVDAHDSGSCG